MSTTEEPEIDLQLSDDELKALADQVAPQLKPGTYDENMVLPRRAVLGVVGGTLSASALLGWGAGSAAAQEDTTWNVGDPDNPANVYGGEGRFETLNTDKYCNIETPEPDSDITDLLGYRTTVLLQPDSEYTFTEIPKSDQLTIKGFGSVDDGPDAPTLRYTGSTGSGSRAIDWGDPSDAIAGTVIENVRIDCGGVETGVYGRYLTDRTKLSRVWVENTDGDAFDISKVWYASLEDIVARDGIGGKGYHIHQDDGDVNNLRMENPQSHGTGDIGFDIEGIVQIDTPEAEQADQEGMVIRGGSSVVLTSPYFESNGQSMSDPVNLEANPEEANTFSLSLIGGHFDGPPGGTNVKIRGEGTATVVNGEYAVDDTSNRPTHHVDAEGTDTVIIQPKTVSYAEDTSLVSGGPIFRGEGITMTSPDGDTTETYGVENDGSWGTI